MVSMLKRGLILVGLLLLPVMAFAAAPEGLDYHKWLQEQNAKGKPADQHNGGGAVKGVPGGNAAESQFFPLTGGNVQLDYKLQVDYTSLMARLKYLLTSPDWFGNVPEVQQAVKMMEAQGCFSATQYREALTIDKDLLRYSVATDYAGLSPESLKGQLYAQPNLPFVSASYVNANALFYFGMHNVPQTALKVFRQLASDPEALENSPLSGLLDEMSGGNVSGADLAQAAQMMDALGIENTVNSMLTGEVALALYGLGEPGKLVQGDIEPEDVDAALFVGLRDSATVAKMLGAYGADMGLVNKGEQGGWQIYGFDGDDTVTLALNSEVLLATTNWQATNMKLMSRMARLPASAGQYAVHLDLDQLCNMVQPIAAMVEQEAIDKDYLHQEFDEYGWPSIDKFDAGLRYLLDLDNLGGAGAINISGYYNNGYRSELTMKPAVFMYGLYALGRWGGMAAAQEALKEMHSAGEEPSEYDYEPEYMDETSGAGAMAGAAPEDGVQVATLDGDSVVPGGDEDLE